MGSDFGVCGDWGAVTAPEKVSVLGRTRCFGREVVLGDLALSYEARGEAMIDSAALAGGPDTQSKVTNYSLIIGNECSAIS